MQQDLAFWRDMLTTSTTHQDDLIDAKTPGGSTVVDLDGLICFPHVVVAPVVEQPLASPVELIAQTGLLETWRIHRKCKLVKPTSGVLEGSTFFGVVM
jgi:hypothetical protein